MKFILISILLNFVVASVHATESTDAGCDGRIEECSTSGGVVDGSLNTNSGNQNSNNSNTGNENNYRDSHNTEHNGNIYSSNGGQQVIKTAPIETNSVQRIESNQVAPVDTTNLITGGQDSCLGSTTAGISIPGFSGAHGTNTVDENCQMIKNVKLLASLGLKDAAACLIYEQGKGVGQAILMAYPQLAEICDPEIKAEKEAEAATQRSIEIAQEAEAERQAKLAKYEAAGLEPPAHLLVPVEVPEPVEVEKEGRDYWYNVEGKKCYWGTVPFTNIKTKVCS